MSTLLSVALILLPAAGQARTVQARGREEKGSSASIAGCLFLHPRLLSLPSYQCVALILLPAAGAHICYAVVEKGSPASGKGEALLNV